MPGIRMTRSSSSASLKLWERQGQSMSTATMAVPTQRLMDQDLRRSDSSHNGTGKRRSFLRRSSNNNSSSRREAGDRFSDDLSQAYPGSISSQVPNEEGIEAILPPTGRKTKKKPKARQLPPQPPPHRPRWRCFQSSSHLADAAVPPVLTACSTSEDSRQERFDQSFDYAFDYQPAIVWDKSALDSSLVDTTFASISSSSSSNHNHRAPPLPNPTSSTAAPAPPKSKPKWRLFSWSSRRKVKRSQSFEEQSRSTPNSPPRQLPNFVQDWSQEQPEEPDWEANMIGDEVECEYRGDITVQDLFSSAPDSPTIQRVSSWGMEQPSIGLEEHEDDPLPNSPGVMELGQYAREMQSKSKPSPARKRQVASLLCVLPRIGKSKAKEEAEEEDFPDPEWVAEPDDDDNSYLAVSYTEEGAPQLVMSQSEDLEQEQRSLQESPRHNKFVMQDDGFLQGYLEEDLSPPTAPDPPLDIAFDEEDKSPSPVQDIQAVPSMDYNCAPVDISQLTDDLKFLGENSIASFASKRTFDQSLGASFPHPAAQLRDELAMRRLRHPSSPLESGEVGEKKPTSIGSKGNVKGRVDDKPWLASKVEGKRFPSLNREKEEEGGEVFGHYKSLLTCQPTGHTDAIEASSIYTPPPVRTMMANLMKKTAAGPGSENESSRQSEEAEPWVLRRRDDPPTQEESPPIYGRYGCPAATTLPSSYPNCTSGRAPRWMSQAPDLSLDQTATRSMSQGPGLSLDQTATRSLESGTVSTLSYSEYPLQERRSLIDSRDLWDLYHPIRQLAKDVNETLCENMYPRTEQPSSVPFDEQETDGRLRQSRPPWSKVVRTQSSSSSNNYYDRFNRENERPRRPRPTPDERERRVDPRERRPDPPSVSPVPEERRDGRRQMVAAWKVQTRDDRRQLV